MLKRDFRLNNSHLIQLVWKKGRLFNGKLIRIKSLKNRVNRPRVAVIIGLKFSKKAHQRNLVKRRLREILKHFIPQLQSFDLIVQPHNLKFELFEYQALFDDIKTIFSKANLLK